MPRNRFGPEGHGGLSPRSRALAGPLVVIGACAIGLLAAMGAPAVWARPAPRAARPVPARSGYVAARTERTVGDQTQVTVARLWFTATRYRLEVQSGQAPATIQLYDGRAVYRWEESDRGGRAFGSGHIWHPTSLSVSRDIVAPLLNAIPLNARRRIGTGRVVGIPCAIYHGTLTAPPGAAAWWKGALDVRMWESLDPRFPFVLRSTASDGLGNHLESQVTTLSLGGAVPYRLLRPPGDVRFYAPAQVRLGRRVAGGPRPLRAPVAIYLADVLPTSRAARGMRVLTFSGLRLALDRLPIATGRDVEEVRMEPYGQAWGAATEALVLYLKPASAAVLARAAARARGRALVVLISGRPASAVRIRKPWAEEENRVLVINPSAQQLADLAARLGGPPPGRAGQ